MHGVRIHLSSESTEDGGSSFHESPSRRRQKRSKFGLACTARTCSSSSTWPHRQSLSAMRRKAASSSFESWRRVYRRCVVARCVVALYGHGVSKSFQQHGPAHHAMVGPQYSKRRTQTVMLPKRAEGSSHTDFVPRQKGKPRESGHFTGTGTPTRGLALELGRSQRNFIRRDRHGPSHL